MRVTPIYGWPFQTLGDQPHGPNLGEQALMDVEATVNALEARIATLEGFAPYRALQTLSGPLGTVTFTGIPTNLRKLEVTWTVRSTAAVVAANLRMRVNNDSAINYNANFTQQNNITITGNTQIAATFWQVGVVAGASATANNFGAGLITVSGWNAPHPNINQNHTSHFYESAVNSWFESGGGLYFAAAPYNRLDFFLDSGNVDTNSQFLVLGWP